MSTIVLVLFAASFAAEPATRARQIADPTESRPSAPKHEPANAATRTIRGRVVNEAGEPVAGARVWHRLQYWPNRTVSTTTDEAGRYELTLPADWASARWSGNSWTIWAFAPEYSIGSASVFKALKGRSDEDCDITLPPRGSIRYRILSLNGRPLVGAVVQPTSYRAKMGIDLLPDEMLSFISATTDADGIAALPATQPGMLYRVQIVTKEFGNQVISVERDKATAIRDIQLREVGKIEVRLVGEKPEWLRGVRLNIGARDQFEQSFTEGKAEIVTDDNGRFEIPAFASGGPLHILAFFDRSIPVRPIISEQLYVAAGETLKLEIPFVPAPIARGKIVSKSTGKPIANAEVSLSYGTFRQHESAVTNENGHFEGRVLPGPVRTQIISLPPEYMQLGEPWANPFQFPAGVNEFDLPTIEVVDTRTLNGKLVGANDQPLKDVNVSAGNANRRYGFGITDAEGKFSMRVPDGVDLNFTVNKEEEIRHASAQVVQRDPLILRYVVDAREQKFDADRVNKADVALVGRVLTDDKPLAGVSLTLSRGIPTVSRIRPDGKAPDRPMTAMRFEKVATAVTDADGRYRLPGLKAGDPYQINVAPPFPAADPAWRHQMPYSQKVPEAAQGDVSLPELKLRKLTQTLAGTVVDPDGKPVAGARVSAMLRDGRGFLSRSSLAGPPPWTDTDKDGRFKLHQLPDEPLSIMARIPSKSGGPIRFPAQVNVEKNQQDIRIVLDPSLAEEEK